MTIVASIGSPPHPNTWSPTWTNSVAEIDAAANGRSPFNAEQPGPIADGSLSSPASSSNTPLDDTATATLPPSAVCAMTVDPSVANDPLAPNAL